MPDSLDALPTPRKIFEYLERHVSGQEKAKKVLAVAVYNHFKRIFRKESQGDSPGAASEIEKSNVLLLGPTGSGKTMLVKTIARYLDVPCTICDCSNLTEAGYIGGKIENVFPELLQSAGNDVARAQHAIVLLDEVDKIASNVAKGCRDVGGRGVQQAMLKIVEGTLIKSGAATIDTTDILFIASGAFVALDTIVDRRKTSSRPSTDLHDSLVDKSPSREIAAADILLESVEARDLVQFGLIPEFVGRFPVICALQSLSEDMLVRILDGPENSLLSQFRMLFRMEECDLTFDDDALRSIAQRALKLGTGARGLRAIVEEILLEPQFDIPKSDIISIHVHKEAVEGGVSADYTRKTKNNGSEPDISLSEI